MLPWSEDKQKLRLSATVSGLTYVVKPSEADEVSRRVDTTQPPWTFTHKYGLTSARRPTLQHACVQEASFGFQKGLSGTFHLDLRATNTTTVG